MASVLFSAFLRLLALNSLHAIYYASSFVVLSALRRAGAGKSSRLAFLELQFQGELDLSRRPEISGREPRALNDPERCARRRQHRIAKIRMVENVEQFGAELHVEPLGYFRVFGHRKIGVQEVRSDNRISPKGPGMTGAGNDGIDPEARRGRVAAGRNVAEGAGDRKRCIGRRRARRNAGAPPVGVPLNGSQSTGLLKY